MDQLRKIYGSLSPSQRIGILAAVLAVFGAASSIVHWRHQSNFKPLFSGMASEDAAAVVQKLKESGVEHQLIDNGSTILVPSERVDEIRIEMAGAGLPRTGRIGFELFDKSNLGITDFTEHVNYRRALEGELERSVRAINGVEQDRIHLTFSKDSVFLDSREAAKASVLVSLRPGARLSDANVVAISNLVASAVEGLNPELVSVVDMRGNLLSRPRKSGGEASDTSDAALEYKHQIERDLLAKVQSTLNPLLGDNHFRAAISVDCDLTTSEQTDELYDPAKSVMTNSQKSEDVSSGSQSSGVPGTASNLPRSGAAKQAIGGGANVSRRTENVSYETSRTVRQTKTPRGAIKRISASLLLDQEMRTEGKGAKAKQVSVPPSAEQLKVIRDVVAGVIGFTPDRGDQLIVETLPFAREHEELPAPDNKAPPANKLLTDPKMLAGVGVGLLVLIAAVFMLIERGKKQKAVVSETAARLAASTAASANSPKSAEVEAVEPAQLEIEEELPRHKMLEEASVRIERLRKNLRESVAADPNFAAGVIRSWIQEEEA